MAALTSCVLGLIGCPFLYIALGAPLQFPPQFSLILGPPLLMGSGFLLWRFLLARQALQSHKSHKSHKSIVLLEGLSWIAIIFFLYAVSNFIPQTPIERVGATSFMFLVAAVLWAPFVVWKKDIPIQVRLSRLNTATAVVSLLVILLVSSGFALNWLFSKPAFI